jgi:hypothetical protein
LPEDNAAQVKVVKSKSSIYFGVSYNTRDDNYSYLFEGTLRYYAKEIEAAKSYDRLVLASGRTDLHLNFVWQPKK